MFSCLFVHLTSHSAGLKQKTTLDTSGKWTAWPIKALKHAALLFQLFSCFCSFILMEIEEGFNSSSICYLSDMKQNFNTWAFGLGDNKKTTAKGSHLQEQKGKNVWQKNQRIHSENMIRKWKLLSPTMKSIVGKRQINSNYTRNSLAL